MTVLEKLAEDLYIALVPILREFQKKRLVRRKHYKLTPSNVSKTHDCQVLLNEDEYAAKVVTNSSELAAELASSLSELFPVGKVENPKWETFTFTISFSK